MISQAATLDELGLKYKTDKSSAHHNYLDFYGSFLAPLRDQEITVLEVGVLNGASLKMWEEYFPRAHIIGADINRAVKRFETGRVTIEILDQSNIEELVQVAMKYGPFDIVIEDGSHKWEHQITSLRTLFPFVKDRGFYAVEDLQTNFGVMREKFRGVGSQTCVEYLKQWVDLRVADGQLPLQDVEDAFLRTYGRAAEYLIFYRRACLIRKQQAQQVRGKQPDRTVKPIAPPGDTALPIGVRAHLSLCGNVSAKHGYVFMDGDEFTIQGLALDYKENVFEYRVQTTQNGWSPWVEAGTFAGTRGRAQILTGFAVRLLPGARDHFDLRTYGRFAGMDAPVTCADGEDCVSSTGSALCGLQIDLAPRGAA